VVVNEQVEVEGESGDDELIETWGGGMDLDLLELLAHLDVISRLDALRHWLCGHKSWRFAFRRDGGMAGIEVERLLLRHGIRMWDRDFDKVCLSFRVHERLARFAEWLMLTQGVALVSELVDPRHANVERRDEPQARGPALKPSLMNRVLELFLE